MDAALAWRHAALAGAATGLATAPHLPPPPLSGWGAMPLLAAATVALAIWRPGPPRARGSGPAPGAAWPWLALLVILAATVGAMAGQARVAAIDRGAFAGEVGDRVTLRGFVAGVPRPQDGLLVVPVATEDGRVVVEVPEPDQEVQVGREIRAEGVVREPEPWQAGRLRIAGVRRLVAARELEATGRRRGGAAGLVDAVRDRAEAALERGVPSAEAALARGFVLGQDDRIDPATVDDFRRSGLAHLLAVSGQNVLLLALLAFPVLAILGVPLRARLVVVIALIALYVPITGAGPSIQRAAVMGAAGIVAVLAGRPSHRWYALLLAAVVTLAVNPRAAADVGWQLSFAAVVGILLWARPLAELARRRLGAGPSRLRSGLAEGIGVTVAATLATAPLSALHFEMVSLASLPANLLALPAVAPVMWLGMLSAGLGQLSWFPVEPLNWLCSLLVAYIAQIADWLGEPAWASLPVTAPSPAAVAVIALALGLVGFLAVHALRRRRALGGARSPLVSVGVSALLTLALVVGVREPDASPPGPSPGRLMLTFFDVGQGDAILLDPAPGDPVLVDSGPSGTDLPAELAERGVEHLGAAIITHDQADHAGGLAEVLREVEAGAVVEATPSREVRATARTAGVPTRLVRAGAVLRTGALRLRVLWPPVRGPAAAPRGEDPNERSIVLLARWHRFDALLAGDAEAELAPIDPGPVDLLKVAHHGSEDAGLAALLDRAEPALAVISAAAGNPYGHPHPATLATLAEAGVPALRTDDAGDVEISVGPEAMHLAG